MSDLISRQAAIDALSENKEMINAALDSLILDYNTRKNQEQRREQINEDIETIKALPSEDGIITSLFCNKCGYENQHWYKWHYCPNCGARMEIEQL